MLYHLEKMKNNQWDKLWSIVAKRTAIVYGSARLGDQDVMNAVIKQNPKIVYEVPCQWNTQLSDYTLSYRCYKNNPIKASNEDNIFVNVRFLNPNSANKIFSWLFNYTLVLFLKGFRNRYQIY